MSNGLAPLYKTALTFGVLIVILTASAHTEQSVSGASAPTVDTITAAASSGGSETSLTLSESTTTMLYVHGTISDADGCADVATNGSVTAKFFRSSLAEGADCSADNNDCYVIANAACTKTACDGTPEDTLFSYECTAPIQYYADSTASGPHANTNWTARIAATDASPATGYGSDTIEMESTIALDVTPSIDYGSVALGAESAEQTLTVTNVGNNGIDVDLSVSGPMNCTTGVVTPGDIHYSATQGFSYAGGTSLSNTPTEFELDLGNRTNDATPSTKNVYLKLKMPQTGAGGSCSNTLTITGKADVESGW